MRSRAELQDWMRNGCSVVEPPPVSVPVLAHDLKPGNHRLFFLKVRRTTSIDGEIVVNCTDTGCDWDAVCPGMIKPDPNVEAEGVANAVGKARDAMAAHAIFHGMGEAQAWRAFKQHEIAKPWGWAEDLMHGGREVKGGMIAMPGSDWCGYYLDPEPYASPLPSMLITIPSASPSLMSAMQDRFTEQVDAFLDMMRNSRSPLSGVVITQQIDPEPKRRGILGRAWDRVRGVRS